MTHKNKVEYLVVDTSAFIKNTSLQEIATNIFTVQEVVDEIINKRQLRNLVVLPYDIKIKDVFSENIKFISDLSKKTGDYPSLSATDIKVMALTYQLEKEKIGTNHLKTETTVNRVVNFTKHLTENHKDVVGFYLPPQEDENTEEDASLNEKCVNSEGNIIQVNVLGSEVDNSQQQMIETVQAEHEKDQLNLQNEVSSGDEEFEDEDKDKEFEGEDLEDEDVEDDETLDDIGWITPSNITEMKQKMHSDIANDTPVVVACITADFAMQNVLKQVGLNVISVDGCLIRELRTFILRCYACFKTTSVMTKVFCPHCGNKTLKRVAVSLKEDGTQEIHISTKRPLTSRGKRFSLPRPRGGKHANNPILCEGQRVPHQRPARLARIKNNPLDPDYIAAFSPFIMRDINSRAAMLGIRGNSPDVKNWMRKNPNEARRKGKKKT